MTELRCGTCGQLDYDELKIRYDKAVAFIRNIKEFGSCHCVAIMALGKHVYGCRWRAEDVLKELGE